MAGARTMLRQASQVSQSFDINDRLASGVALQTNADSVEYDLNALRSMAALHADTGGTLHWYDSPPAGLKQLNSSVIATQQQPFNVKSCNYTAITVPSGQNYVVLSASGGQAPAAALAVSPTSFGTVVAVSAQNGAAFAGNELTQLAGADALHPKNRINIVSNADGSPIEDANTLDIYGLLQVESTTVDGSMANDTSGGNRVKISFVKIDRTAKQFVAANSADVAGKVINYMYSRRMPFSQVPETALGGDGAWVDNIGAADVTMTRAVANQAGAGIPVNSPVLFQVAPGQSVKVQSASGGSDYLAVAATSSASSTSVNTTTFQVTTTSASQFSQGIQAAQTTTPINVGITAGQIDASGLTVTSTGTNPLKLVGGAGVTFKDGFLAQSTWSTSSVPLASSAAEWSSYKTYFGESSIASALITSFKSTTHRLVHADVLPATIAAGTNVTGAGGGANISSQFPDYSAASDFTSSCKLMYNGILLRPGANQAAGQDWWPGTNRATGDVMLGFILRGVAGLPTNKNDELAFEYFSAG